MQRRLASELTEGRKWSAGCGLRRRLAGGGRRAQGRRRARGDGAAPPRPAVDRPSQVGSVASAGAVGFEPNRLNQIKKSTKIRSNQSKIHRNAHESRKIAKKFQKIKKLMNFTRKIEEQKELV
jgi:hypothetical protein